jgi:hypothetical protein
VVIGPPDARSGSEGFLDLHPVGANSPASVGRAFFAKKRELFCKSPRVSLASRQHFFAKKLASQPAHFFATKLAKSRALFLQKKLHIYLQRNSTFPCTKPKRKPRIRPNYYIFGG